MQNTEVVILTRRSRLGFGFSIKPSGQGTEILPPYAPYVYGTFKTIKKKLSKDRLFQSLKTVFKNTAFFHQGRRLVIDEADLDLLISGTVDRITARYADNDQEA